MTYCLWSIGLFWLFALAVLVYAAITAPTLPDYDDDGEW